MKKKNSPLSSLIRTKILGEFITQISGFSQRERNWPPKSKAITLAANPTGSIEKITEIKLTYNKMHWS